MTSNNKTVSRQKSLSRQQCKIYDVRGYCYPQMYYITNHLMTGPSGNSSFCFSRVSILFGKSVSKKRHHLSFRALANDVNGTESQPNVLYLIV